MNKFEIDGIPLFTVSQTGSTNSDLLEHPAYQATGACALRAIEQTAGRGRQGRPWLASEDALLFSVRWPFARSPQALSGLTLAVALSLTETLASAGYADVKIKWPNDLYHDNKKLGGILVELGKTSVNTPAIIGVGINIQPLPTPVDQPTTSLSAFGPATSADSLYPLLVRELFATCQEFDANGFAPFRHRWESHALWIGQGVTSGHLSGLLAGVDDSGAAIIRTLHGDNQLFSGDLSLTPLESKP